MTGRLLRPRPTHRLTGADANMKPLLDVILNYLPAPNPSAFITKDAHFRMAAVMSETVPFVGKVCSVG